MFANRPLFTFLLFFNGVTFGLSIPEDSVKTSGVCYFIKVEGSKSILENFGETHIKNRPPSPFDVLGYLSPSLGFGISIPSKLGNMPFRWCPHIMVSGSHEVYNYWYDTFYYDPVSQINYPYTKEKYVTVNKLFIQFRNDLKIPISDRYFLGPVIQFDYRILELIPTRAQELERLGIYSESANRLLRHPRGDVKLGLNGGVSMKRRWQFQLTAAYGLLNRISFGNTNSWHYLQTNISFSYSLK
ncbi:MAG: hypothetical protein GC181_09985 [Bacteroidetes bacterium]|nr:hypothetical protein [Bacteroidota bacterium]